MKNYGLLWLMLLALPFAAPSAEKDEITLYLQLIRGTDGDQPPAADARMAGPELSRRLQMFKWKNYWEINRRSVLLGNGQKTRQLMTAEREVEITRKTPQELTISIYTKGKLSRRRTQSLETPFYIAGGDKDGEQCWFIVLRHDKPSEGKVARN